MRLMLYEVSENLDLLLQILILLKSDSILISKGKTPWYSLLSSAALQNSDKNPLQQRYFCCTLHLLRKNKANVESIVGIMMLVLKRPFSLVFILIVQIAHSVCKAPLPN